ncbi:metal-dependent hydrolase [Altererythrobacter sp. ZODW24]|uniref:metal-dependent hydrolase n=1 Tax=Altererythrobacter sp. ZODW24 TaxID=2185142 RepID=UPI000DF7BCC5|nr:metal-dependent hydrolase [Altererythrobacter sp. ZODW24]
MDNLTHSLVGALLGQTGLKRKTGLAMPALIIGANLPDVDAACLFWLDGVEHLGFRRGITHGPPALVLLPLILAGLLYGFDRWQTKRGKRPEGRLPVHFGWLFALSFIGCLTHPAMDWLNVYGVRFLEPFSSQWFYGDTLFIIDVWLWALMGFATWFSLRREKKTGGDWRKPARIAIAASLAYIGLNAAFTAYLYDYETNSDPTRKNIVSPVPLQFWKREVLTEEASTLWNSTDWNGSLTNRDSVNRACFGNCPGYPDAQVCSLSPVEEIATSNSQVAAFLFWSRAPFAERAEDGSVLLRDARFYDPLARDRFTVALPDVECVELATP